MASSRIFVKGLPPIFSEAEFKKHFSQSSRDVTDVKIFPSRRIGYIGFRTSEEAKSAVKYFNKTFIRMSRIGVELARSVDATRSSGVHSTPLTAKEDVKVDSNYKGNLKRKREEGPEIQNDTKLKEFVDLWKPKSKKTAWENETSLQHSEPEAIVDDATALPDTAGQSDSEYEDFSKRSKAVRRRSNSPSAEELVTSTALNEELAGSDRDSEMPEPPKDTGRPAASDSDWARSRTSRLLDLTEDGETLPNYTAGRNANEELSKSLSEPEKIVTSGETRSATQNSMPTPPSEGPPSPGKPIPVDADIEAVRSSMRLFIRNLPFDVKQEDLELEFASYGNMEQVHLPLDTKSGLGKGFAYVQYTDPESAEQALVERDGQVFQGRLLHVLPASIKRETKLDDFALSKLPLKKQHQIKKRREAASTTFNWNSLYMNADAVVSAVANRLGLSKSEVLDPTSSDAAVKQAHAETHIIQETKTYFRQQGVDLDSFKKSQRGDTAILVKNVPFDCARDDLKRLFEEHGTVKRFLMPPSGVIAIIELANVAQSQSAFGALAYRKIKGSVLFLEKAPKNIFAAKPTSTIEEPTSEIPTDKTAPRVDDSEKVVPTRAGTATLFVRNLNFTTSSQVLKETFTPLDGFLSARVKTKTDPKRPRQVLSMGFGFLEFATSQQAQVALEAMDGYTLEGHKLQIRASHRGMDAAEERRMADTDKKAAGQRTKIIIKNLPFEATKKDIRALFGPYGQLRSVRVPKKMDRATRGFGFADFLTAKEAQSAMDALRDTHLLGRRLVLDFAAEDPEDAEAEIEKMQQKVGAQVNKVALRNLTSGGRRKFNSRPDDED